MEVRHPTRGFKDDCFDEDHYLSQHPTACRLASQQDGRRRPICLNCALSTARGDRLLSTREYTAIINYDMPSSSEAYVFRIGRMGRSGMSPIRAVICFVTQGDYLLLQEIERRHGGGAIEPLPRDVPHLFPLLPCVNS